MSDHETWKCRRCGEHHPVPRDPAAYEASVHFQQRYKFRDTPENVVEDCIVDGEAKRDGKKERFRLFESKYPRNETWRIVVALRPQGYHDDGTHEAVTVYEVSDPPDRNF